MECDFSFLILLIIKHATIMEYMKNQNHDLLEKLYCTRCDYETNQKVLLNKNNLEPREIFSNAFSDNSVWIVIVRIWTISECTGCNYINGQIETRTGPNKEHSEIEILSPSKKSVSPQGWMFELPRLYAEMIVEIYNSINIKSYRLTAIGIRTLLDLLIADSVGDKGTYKEKIERLIDEQIINKNQYELTNLIIEAGNAAAHRAHKPDIETLGQILDMVENILRTQVLLANSKKIKDSIPKRT